MLLAILSGMLALADELPSERVPLRILCEASYEIVDLSSVASSRGEVGDARVIRGLDGAPIAAEQVSDWTRWPWVTSEGVKGGGALYWFSCDGLRASGSEGGAFRWVHGSALADVEALVELTRPGCGEGPVDVLLMMFGSHALRREALLDLQFAMSRDSHASYDGFLLQDEDVQVLLGTQLESLKRELVEVAEQYARGAVVANWPYPLDEVERQALGLGIVLAYAELIHDSLDADDAPTLAACVRYAMSREDSIIRWAQLVNLTLLIGQLSGGIDPALEDELASLEDLSATRTEELSRSYGHPSWSTTITESKLRAGLDRALQMVEAVEK